MNFLRYFKIYWFFKWTKHIVICENNPFNFIVDLKYERNYSCMFRD